MQPVILFLTHGIDSIKLAEYKDERQIPLFTMFTETNNLQTMDVQRFPNENQSFNEIDLGADNTGDGKITEEMILAGRRTGEIITTNMNIAERYCKKSIQFVFTPKCILLNGYEF